MAKYVSKQLSETNGPQALEKMLHSISQQIHANQNYSEISLHTA